MDVNIFGLNRLNPTSLQKSPFHVKLTPVTGPTPTDHFSLQESEQAYGPTGTYRLPGFVDNSSILTGTLRKPDSSELGASQHVVVRNSLDAVLEESEPRIDQNWRAFLPQASQPLTTETTWINPLADVPAAKMGPIGDLLEWDPATIREKLTEREPQIRELAIRQRDFSAAYKNALTRTFTDKNGQSLSISRTDAWQNLKNLENFLLSGEKPRYQVLSGGGGAPSPAEALYLKDSPKNLRPEELTALMTGYQDVGSFNDMIRLYQDARKQDPSLAQYDIPREQFIMALNRAGSGYIKGSIEECESLLRDRLVGETSCSFSTARGSGLLRVKRNLGMNSQLLNSLGKAYRNIAQLAEGQMLKLSKQQDFAKFVSDFTGVPIADFKVHTTTARELGEQRASRDFTARMSILLDRDLPSGSLERNQNDFDIQRWVELKSGVPMGQWPGQPDRLSVVRQLRDAKDPLAAAETLCGRRFSDWELTKKEVLTAASEPFDKWGVRAAAGQDSKTLSDLAEKVTGTKPSGFVYESALDVKVGELRSKVSQGNQIDPELVDLVAKKSGFSAGQNLATLSRQAMEVARSQYREGFAVDFDFLPGMNLLYCEQALGNHETVKGLIPLIQHAVLREGGRSTNEYFNLATQTELAALGQQPETLYNLLPRVLGSAKVAWQLETTIAGLKKMSELRANQGQDHAMLDLVAKTFSERVRAGFPPKEGFNLDRLIQQAQNELGVHLAPLEVNRPQSPEVESARWASQTIFQKSKNFNDAFRSKFVGGSWAHTSKGGVSDTVINRPTVTALRHINHYLGLDHLNSPEQFPEVVSKLHEYIDAKFGLVDQNGDRPMEDLHSQVHKERDAFTENRHDLTMSRVSGNSRTNLITEIALGQSDCRHTAATFQACCDLWKRDQQTRELQTCLDAVFEGDQKVYQAAFQRAQAWNKFQVVTMDLAFKADVQLETDNQGRPKKYALVHDEQGRFVRTPDGQMTRDPKSGAVVALEDHTMPFVLKLSDDGQFVESMRAVDPFYRKAWNVGDVEVDPLDVLDPEKGFYLGNKGSVASDGKPIHLYGVPCSYSGRPLESNPGECGQVTLGGLEYSLKDLDALLSLRPKMKAFTDTVSTLS